MYILKKKHLIKIISVFMGLALVIVGLVFYIKSIKKSIEKEALNRDITLISNISAAVGIIDSSFTKALATDSFEIEKITICTQALTVRNILFLHNENCEKTALFFLELSEYAKSDMQDSAKNEEYSRTISTINKNMISICTSKNKNVSLLCLEDIFPQTQEDYDKMLREIEKEYSYLNNRVQADRQDISTYAKTILDIPYPAPVFKGNYIFPKAVSFSSKNAYANIFISGKTLLIMSEQESEKAEYIPQSLAEIARNALVLYAPYASEFEMIHSIEKEGISYFIFCPIQNSDSKEIINYDESVKIALSNRTGHLQAFDATSFLKKHPSIPKEIPSDNIGNDSKNSRLVIIGQKCYIETKTNDNSLIFKLEDTQNNTTRLFTEDEYFLFIA
ncbi:MAG: hypothetical protein IKU45_01510 [Clostridia bacterium]|nr:hypothetical protein [Clostridia bacterium]